MSTMEAIPKVGSYVLDWEAVQLDSGGNDVLAVRRLLKNTPWIVQLNLLVRENKVKYNFVAVHGGGGIEQWELETGDWVVKSPHGKVWFMGDEEFRSQFTVRAG